MFNKQQIKRVDPEPILLSLGILSSTAAVVGMIDVIRRARRQERIDKEEALRRDAEDARLEREEQRQIREDERRQKELEDQQARKLQRQELIKLDSLLEAIETRVTLIEKIIERSERIGGTNRYWLSEEDFYRYKEHANDLISLVPKISEAVLEIEPTLDEKALSIDENEPIEDDLDFNEEEVLQVVDQAWLSSVVKKVFPGHASENTEPFKALKMYIEMTRRRMSYILNN